MAKKARRKKIVRVGRPRRQDVERHASGKIKYEPREIVPVAAGAGGANLTINSGNTQILEGSLGATVVYEYMAEDGSVLRPELRAAALYEFLGDNAAATAKYSGTGATWTCFAKVERYFSHYAAFRSN